MPCISKMIPCSSNMAKVVKAPILACLTCPLCGSLFREATTISECLHTFCKECIHERFSDDEINSCPMCNVDLGTVPLEKLRADPQLDDVQTKIFMSDPGKRPVFVVNPTQSTPMRRKERSLSSLGIKSVPSSSRPRRRTRRKTWVTESSEAEDSDDEPPDLPSQEPEGTYNSETLDSDSKSGSDSGPGTSTKKRRLSRVSASEAKESGGDLSALSCLAELAHADNNTRSSKGSTKGSLRATKNVRRSSQGRVESQPNGASKPSTANVNSAIWFILKSATIQGDDKDTGFPQIKAPYLRIKDGRLPVSYVKKYLAKKLDLKNESEVEITCGGQPVVSSLPLESVRKIWLTRIAASQEQASSTGQEFLMVLTYGKSKRALVAS